MLHYHPFVSQKQTDVPSETQLIRADLVRPVGKQGGGVRSGAALTLGTFGHSSRDHNGHLQFELLWKMSEKDRQTHGDPSRWRRQQMYDTFSVTISK